MEGRTTPAATPWVVPVLVLLAGIVPLLLACGSPDSPPPPPSADVWRGTGAEVEVTVSDLHCEGCATRAVDSLGAVKGVEAVAADPVTDVIRLTLRDTTGRDASIARIRAEIHAQGWKVVGEDRVAGE